MLLDAYAMNRDERMFDDPDTWRPERQAQAMDDSFVSLTFGLGPRLCIGIGWSFTVLKLVLTQVLERFEILATEPERPDFRADFASLRVPGGIPAVLAPVS